MYSHIVSRPVRIAKRKGSPFGGRRFGHTRSVLVRRWAVDAKVLIERRFLNKQPNAIVHERRVHAVLTANKILDEVGRDASNYQQLPLIANTLIDCRTKFSPLPSCIATFPATAVSALTAPLQVASSAPANRILIIKQNSDRRSIFVANLDHRSASNWWSNRFQACKNNERQCAPSCNGRLARHRTRAKATQTPTQSSRKNCRCATTRERWVLLVGFVHCVFIYSS
jgi:hypothetical protein